jgi:Esterase-like activity of phytase/Glycosyl transferase family 2
VEMTVRDWFEQRSFHHRDFGRLAVSGPAVRQSAVTLILPAREVAATIGPILDTVARLNERSGLIDQVLVIDADSADGTADVARAHGAEVYSENALMPEYGPAQGKGDAMWRALSVARGDIVMFADTDTRDFGEHFIYGTLGPLLMVPGVQFSKAAYRRPFASGEESIADGGGRVTELTAKPLLNFFFPELTGFVQPLAGEFAARRDGPDRSRLAAEPPPAAVGPDQDELRRPARAGPPGCRPGPSGARAPGTRPVGHAGAGDLPARGRRPRWPAARRAPDRAPRAAAHGPAGNPRVPGRHVDGTAYDGTNSDNEGLAVLPDGDYLVSSETEPSIRIYGRDGVQKASLPGRPVVTRPCTGSESTTSTGTGPGS